MRELPWLRGIVVDVAYTLGSEIQNPVELKKRVFEDNNVDLALAKKPGLTGRNMYMPNKYFFIKEHIGEEKGIILLKVESEDQLSDKFNTGMVVRIFFHLRDKLMGWVQ